jgi:tetratricopeptide (TPR) repeat protein
LDSGHQGLRLFTELSDDVGQAYAWTEIGHALAALHRWDEAQASYQRALDLRRALAQPHLEMEVVAGLIRVDRARQDVSEAKRKAQRLYHYLETNRPLGTEEPIRIYWTCFLALHEEENAHKLLNDAQQMLEERAAAIDEPLRHAFLQEIEVHRAVRETWASYVQQKSS